MNYSEYSPDWKDVIRPSILKRDSYKCRHCGIKHKVRVYKNSRGHYVECDDFIENWAKTNGFRVFTIYLHVAHMDQDKSNNTPDNLMSLCPRCHSKYDSKFKKFGKIKYQKRMYDTVDECINLDNTAIKELFEDDNVKDSLIIIGRALEPYIEGKIKPDHSLFGIMARLSSIHKLNQ